MDYPTYRPHPFNYRERINRLCQKVPFERGWIVIRSAPIKYMSNDIDYLYRPLTDMIYLTGFPEPESTLVIKKYDNEIKTCLYVRFKDPKNEIWTGKYFGLSGTLEYFSVDDVENINQLDKDLEDSHETIYEHNDVKVYIQELRLAKDKEEISLMRQACVISAKAHWKAMQYARKQYARRKYIANIKLTEHQINAVLTYKMFKHGCRRLAYPHVVAAGENGLCLHYDAYSKEILDDELVLVDAGCEHEFYASDITRTWPVSGMFTPMQEQIYGIVLRANKECIEMAKPGKTFRDLQDHANKVISDGLRELGLLKDDWIKKFFMHNVGHWIGIDVHDCRDIDRWEVVLEPGHCLTIEPGIYIHPDDSIPKEYWNIGIRIEDDIAITEDGCEVLSKYCPKEIEEMENW